MHPALSSLLSRRLLDRQDGHRRKVVAALQDHLRIDGLSPEERRAEQDRRLAALLEHARATVPFYREKLSPSKDPILPADARAMLSALPVVDRSAIQAQPDAFRSIAAGEVVADATGGSTGTPMRFFVDRATQRAREASLYWSDGFTGWRYGERIAMLWGSDKDVRTAAQDLRMTLRWTIDNRRWFNAFNMGEERMAGFHRSMTRFRPHVIVAYAGSMDVYARFLEDRGITPSYPVRGIVCSAEVLTPQARETITRVFGKPVFNRYGNREFGAIATECSAHQGLHVNEADMILEIDSADPYRIPGPLLVTFLHNKAMPFLRYNTGDLCTFAATDACACGRNLLRIQSISGRMSDTVRTRDGKLIHGEFFTHLLYGAKNIREFQFVQDSLEEYRLLLVASEPEGSSWEDRVRESILEEVGPGCQVTIRYVESIPVLPSGKRKFTLSRLQ